jgi:aryl sulfotransferase
MGDDTPFCYAHGVNGAPFRYQSHDEDSARWLGFRFRPGDIVISTRRRTGTTWMQMICALLIFQRPELPAPLWHLSPWLDHTIVPPEVVYARLAEQPYRRFIKTHTPLDGIPADPRVTYIVTARHPLDMFVSLRHQLDNIDRTRVQELTGSAAPAGPSEPLRDSLLRWIGDDGDPHTYPESLPGVMWHLSGAWARRGEPNVLLVHYDDLRADLEGQMRGIAWRLGIAVPEQAWPALTYAASFQCMRDHADRLVPATQGIFRDTASFFRRGTSGAGREILSEEEMARYHARAARLAPPDMLDWLHSPSSARSAGPVRREQRGRGWRFSRQRINE